MKQDRFDDLARRLANRASRRRILQGTALGGAAIAFGHGAIGSALLTQSAFAQDTQRRSAGSPDIAKLAFDLEYDRDRIFAFVATEIAYEPYSGVLRGPVGTLWGKAGNSFDQALLLRALLVEAQIDSRLVVGLLSDETAAQLLLSTQLTLDEWSERFIAASGVDSLSEDDKPIAGTPVAATVDDLLAKAALYQKDLHDTTLRQVKDQVALVQQQLESAGIAIETVASTLPDRELRRHAWIQVANGTEWLDCDPSITEAAVGDAYATNPEQIEDFDLEEYHQVAFRVLGDVVRGGTVTQEEWLTSSARSADLVGQPINFFHVKPGSMGVAINEALGGTDQYSAILQIGETSAEGQLFIFTGQGGITDVLGGGGSNEGEPVAEWLEITIASPDQDAIVELRPVFDRIGEEARENDTVDEVAADLDPIEQFTFEEESIGPYYLPLVGVTNLAVVSASVPTVYFKQDWSIHDTAGDLSFQNHGFHFVRDNLAHNLAGELGTRFYRDRPTVTALGVSLLLDDKKQLASTVSFDLIQPTTRAIALADVETDAHANVLEGVLNQICERNYFEFGARAVGDGLPAEFVGVSRLMETAAEQNISMTTLAPDASISPDAQSQFSAAARHHITSWLEKGYVVIVPDAPVSFGQGTLTGFWAVDPATGRTIDRLETGGGSELAENATLLDVVLHVIHEAYVLGACVAGLGFAAASLISMAVGGASNGGVAGAVGGAVTGAGFCLAAASGAHII